MSSKFKIKFGRSIHGVYKKFQYIKKNILNLYNVDVFMEEILLQNMTTLIFIFYIFLYYFQKNRRIG